MYCAVNMMKNLLILIETSVKSAVYYDYADIDLKSIDA